MTLEELAALLTERVRRPIPRSGRDVLECAADVRDALAQTFPAPEPKPLDFLSLGCVGNPMAMLGTDIVTVQVSCAGCTVIGEGTITFQEAA